MIAKHSILLLALAKAMFGAPTEYNRDSGEVIVAVQVPQQEAAPLTEGLIVINIFRDSEGAPEPMCKPDGRRVYAVLGGTGRTQMTTSEVVVALEFCYKGAGRQASISTAYSAKEMFVFDVGGG
ncbi:hypothetical protein N657DRAFT_632626 [Parathielavia appendiculata]|uniref:Uncharacterized protein n=1 Tax=Parathielavia appendiculata TaxID=2587402 RepID=A0AAN6U5Y3_9PEZI|nr:hypothetical protein N657DRAFT_632626 [Parathielavia appendiculata]